MNKDPKPTFQINEVVQPSGHGRTTLWRHMRGIITEIQGDSVFVSWHGLEFEEEMRPNELVSVGAFGDPLPEDVRVIRDCDHDGHSLEIVDLDE